MQINRIISIFLSTVFFLVSLFHIPVNAKGEELDYNELYSLSCALIDGDTGRILYEKDGYTKRPMASTTKIMTLILTLEYGDIDELVTISSYASKMPDVQLHIKEGEQYYLKDLCYSLILESHNDVAVAIAEHIGGDVKGFADMMNKKSRELGLSNTYFITPNGLDEKNENGTHSTTAVDLARLMKYCVMDSPAKDEFINICQTQTYSFNDYSGERSFQVNNKNAFLDMMEGVIAGKTGFTADAGYCYVAALNKDDKTYVIALLGCGWPNNKNYKWLDSKKLFDYGIENYSFKSATDSVTPMKQIYIKYGTPEEYIDTYIEDYINIIVSDEEKIALEYNVPDCLSPPIKKGQCVGYIDIIIDNSLFKTINVYSSDTVYEKDYRYYLDMILYTIF